MPLLKSADVLNALEKAMSNAAVYVTTVPMDGQFIRKSEYKVKGRTEATVISGATHSCVSHHTACPKRWKGQCVYDWKIRHRKGCRQ
jgi:hypothetical protein